MRAPPQPDAQAVPAIQAAIVQTDRLLRLVTFPYIVETKSTNPRAQDNWELVAPAMLFSASNCLLSLCTLAGGPAPRREQDAWVLLRRLYEHVVSFAWVAADPLVNAARWASGDYYYRLQTDDDSKKLGRPGLSPVERAKFEQHLQAHKPMPGLLDRALIADKHWSAVFPDHGKMPAAVPSGQSLEQAQGGLWSLRTLYTLIYRTASAMAHPTPMSLHPYVGPGGASNRFAIGINLSEPPSQYAYTFGPIAFAIMLFVTEQVLGVPKASDVKAAFEP